VDDEHEEKVGGLLGTIGGREVFLVPSSSIPPKGGLVRMTSTRSLEV